MSSGTGAQPPGFAFGGPTASSWREGALTRVAELENLAAAFRDQAHPYALLGDRIQRHLDTAREAAEGVRPDRPRRERLKAMLGGSPLERTASNLDAAEIDLLRIAPPEYLHGQLPGLLAGARAHLRFDDPRRQALESICADKTQPRLTPVETDTVIATARAARSAARREMLQIRSFRNILYVTAALLALAVGGLVALGLTQPEVIPLCFAPDDAVVCPTSVHEVITPGSPAAVDELTRDAAQPWDVPLVVIVGFMAASIAAAVAMRKLRGTTTPYSLPVALAVLKLPTGALTAVLGLLLMRGGFVPGLSALDSPAQIIAWAILFGYAQQLFTRFVDDRAQQVLEQVGGQEQPRAPLPDGASVERIAPSGNGTAAPATAPAPAPTSRA